MSGTIYRILKPRTGSLMSFFVRRMNTSGFKLSEKDVEEVQIPVPWGHIAGKWWGDRGVPPIVAVHGWQDNANSFDNLIPLLNVPSVLAIDLPGHGLSSHFPEGFPYDLGENLLALHRIRKHFNWEKMPLLTHSQGAALGFAYTALFPKDVKCLISLECIRSILALFKRECCFQMSSAIDEFLKIEKRKKTDSKPVYKLSQLISMTMEGSMGSILYPEAALTLLKRVIVLADAPSQGSESKVKGASDLEKYMAAEKILAQTLSKEEQEGVEQYLLRMKETLKTAKENLKNFSLDESKNKYYVLNRDPSIRVVIFHAFDVEFLLRASKHIKPPVLSVRSKTGFLYGSGKGIYEKTLDIIKAHSTHLEHHDIDGTHHFHLIQPEKVAQIINEFVKKF